jgi:hypothetical protein
MSLDFDFIMSKYPETTVIFILADLLMFCHQARSRINQNRRPTEVPTPNIGSNSNILFLFITTRKMSSVRSPSDLTTIILF